MLVPLADATGPLLCSVRLLGDLAREVGVVGPDCPQGEAEFQACDLGAQGAWPRRCRVGDPRLSETRFALDAPQDVESTAAGETSAREQAVLQASGITWLTIIANFPRKNLMRVLDPFRSLATFSRPSHETERASDGDGASDL